MVAEGSPAETLLKEPEIKPVKIPPRGVNAGECCLVSVQQQEEKERNQVDRAAAAAQQHLMVTVAKVPHMSNNNL